MVKELDLHRRRAGRERSAIIYTVVESCRRRGIDPYAYLREVLTRLPPHDQPAIPEVLPATWNKTSALVQRPAAS